VRVNRDVRNVLSARSRRGLDGINFLMASAREGVGPCLSVCLKGARHVSEGCPALGCGCHRHWDARAIGLRSLSVLIASDLMRGTGRFNLARGLTALSAGIGAALSNASAGTWCSGSAIPLDFFTWRRLPAARWCFSCC
jgi:hypothetical protein